MVGADGDVVVYDDDDDDDVVVGGGEGENKLLVLASLSAFLVVPSFDVAVVVGIDMIGDADADTRSGR